MLHSPLDRSFLLILWAISKITCGQCVCLLSKITCKLCEFARVTHLCLYSRDFSLYSCHERLPLTPRAPFTLATCTFVLTLKILVYTCTTPLYCTLPSVLIPFIKDIDTLDNFLGGLCVVQGKSHITHK